MKKIVFSMFFLFCAHVDYGQTITLTFTAKDAGTQVNLGLDSVRVKNLTLDCDTTVFGSIPTLVIPVLIGIHEDQNAAGSSFQVMPNVPNPFQGITAINVYLPARGSLSLVLSDNLGKRVAGYQNELGAGFHKFEITANKPGFMLFNAYYEDEIRSAKLVNTSTEYGACRIIYMGTVSGDIKGTSDITGTGFRFYSGNQLQHTAFKTGYNNSILLDSPTKDSTYTFHMNAAVTLPTVSTATITNITQTTASGGGNVISDGGAPVTVRGVCWSTTADPTTADNFSIDGNGTGIFLSSLTGLTPGTLYHVRAYAVNSVGTGYGAEVTFPTDQGVSPIYLLGNATIVGWDNTQALEMEYTGNQGRFTIVAHLITGTDKFIKFIANPGSWVPQWGTDASGTSASGPLVYRPTDIEPDPLAIPAPAVEGDYLIMADTANLEYEVTNITMSLPDVRTTQITNITQTTATGGGNVITEGGSPVTMRGVCWSTSPNPTTANSYTIDGSGPGIFVSNLVYLSPNTFYYVRAYATNSVGTAYGNEVTFTTLQEINLPAVTTATVTDITQTTATSGGNVTSDGGSTVTTRGVCWSTSPNPTTANSFTVDGSGVGTFVSYLTGLTPNTFYYVRAYATNSMGTAYGNEVTFTTLPDNTVPTVTTTEATNLTQTTATSGGNVTSDGGSTVTERGVCWSTSPTPTTSNSHTVDGNGTGTFVSNLTGLTPNTYYYLRAYATNSFGTAYGEELNFITLLNPCPGLTNVSFEGKTYYTVLIGTQCWFRDYLNAGTMIDSLQNQTNNNIKEKYCYRNLESNCDVYGGLYQWDEAMQYSTTSGAQGICPAGWHIPSLMEYYLLWDVLITGVGGKMKETGLVHWWPPNTGATNESGFTGLPGGILNSYGFSFLGEKNIMWTCTEVSASEARTTSLQYETDGVGTSSIMKQYGFSVRCIRDFICGDQIYYDGRVYNTVQIGSQCWIKENLNVGNRINGSEGQTDNTTFEKYCQNDMESNCDVYGGLYQWNEMMQYSTTPGAQGICPDGWHLPTDAEWTTLTTYLGGEGVAGGKMKEAGTTHWLPPNTGATNESGFTGLPGGCRIDNGTFTNLYGRGFFWTSTASTSTNAYERYMNYNNDDVNNTNHQKTYGYSARCIKD